MAPLLPLNASQDDIEDELDFNAVLISSLDQGADDYKERLAELENNRSELRRQLDILQNRGTATTGMDSNDDRPSWWQLPPADNHSDSNDVHDSVLSNDGSFDLPLGGTKRSRADSLRLDSQHPSKRLTPEPSKTVTPASSTESFGAENKANSELEERAKKRQLMAEAAIKRQKDSQLADEKLARDLYQQQTQPKVNGFAPASSSSSSSSFAKPTFQTTLEHDGSYRHPPPQIKVELQSSTQRGRHPTSGPIPRLSRSIVERLLNFSEPKCSSEWLKMCFTQDPTSIMHLGTIWEAYKVTFSPFSGRHSPLSAKDLVKNIGMTFATTFDANKNTLTGIRAREMPTDAFLSPPGNPMASSSRQGSSYNKPEYKPLHYPNGHTNLEQKPPKPHLHSPSIKPEQSPLQTRTPYIKPEPSSANAMQPSQPRHPTDVIDLTGDDSDSGDEDITVIGSNALPPNNRTQKPVLTNSLALRTTQPQPPTELPPLPRSWRTLPLPVSSTMPPLQPNVNQNGIRPLYGANNSTNLPSPQNVYNSALTAAANGARSMVNSFGQSLNHLGNIISGNSALFQSNFEDDDILFGGSRPVLPNPNTLVHPPGHRPYAGYSDRDLYQRRYNEIADHNPEKTQEEINALLENIRPDEEIPAHLRVKTPAAMTITLHKYQELGLTWLKNCEEGTNKGGILADDMGLGKTIQMLSLIVERKSEDPRCKTTLIVAPVALMRQWKQEIEQKIRPSSQHRLTVFTQHGQSKKKSFHELRSFDIVLTTYGTLSSEIRRVQRFQLRQKNDPFARPNSKEQTAILGDEARWYRVILDEAQCIKNKSTQTHQAACLIQAKYRFCMTGTPMMNNVEEFYSLVKFVRIRPYEKWEKFRIDISSPLKSGNEDSRLSAMQKLQALCKAVMLRRTKKSTFEGQPILILPERTTEVENPEFDEDERAFYQSIETKTRLQFNKYLKRGEVGTHYSAVLVLLLRLRQAACHPHLIRDFGIAAAADITQEEVEGFAEQLAPQVVERIKATNGDFECPVCYDAVANPAIFIPCGHDTCRECFTRITDPANGIRDGMENGGGAKCPNCRGPIDTKRVTDFDAFKKVHMPELLTEEERKELFKQEDEEGEDDEDVEGEDSDSRNDDEGDDEVDENGNLVEFIVNDDEDVSEAEEDDGLEDEVSTGSSKKAKKSTATSGKSGPAAKKKDKGKAPAKKREEKGEKKPKKKKRKNKAVTLADLAKLSQRNAGARKTYLRRLRENYEDSAKIRKTMELLEQIVNDSDGEKILVFSQWTSLLDLLEIPVDGKGWDYRRYDGSMNTKMRGDAVDDFRDHKKDVRIMLVSLKAGNAGLNLNMASQVIILDPFWNPFIEEQAIDRAHRIGQSRPVKVHRILVANTVEDRIIELQEKKRALIGEALDEAAGQRMARLGAHELAYLFGVTRSL